MAEFKYFDFAGDAMNAAVSGQKLGEFQRKQNALHEIGKLAAGGNYTGARDAAFASGDINAAKSLQGFQDAQTRRAAAAKNADMAKDAKELNMVLQYAQAAQSPEQYEQGKQALVKNGIDPRVVDMMGSFEQRDFFVQRSLPLKQQFDLMMKREELDVKRQKMDAPTGLQKDLAAAGLKPGSDEFNRAIIQSRTKPAASVNINQNTEGSFNKKLSEDLGKEFVDRRGKAKDAILSLQSNTEAKRLLDKGIISGFGANFRLSFGKALQLAGINFSQNAVKNTEAFAASRAKEVGRIIQLFGAGTGLSDADREFARQAAAGEITMTEPSIRKIIDINDRAARNIIKAYNNEARQINPNVAPFPLTVQMPGERRRQNPARQQTNSSNTDALSAARDAIARGADRNAVIQRLRQNGIDPRGL